MRGLTPKTGLRGLVSGLSNDAAESKTYGMECTPESVKESGEADVCGFESHPAIKLAGMLNR